MTREKLVLDPSTPRQSIHEQASMTGKSYEFSLGTADTALSAYLRDSHQRQFDAWELK